MAIRLNGVFLSNGEAVTKVLWDGGDFSTTDYESIDFGDKVTVSKVAGQGRYAVGRTSGYYEADDSKIGMYFDKYCELEAALAAKAVSLGVHLTDVAFDIAINWASGDTVHGVKLLGCRIISRALATKSGDAKPEVVNFSVSVLKVEIDDRCLVDDVGVA